ncbi:MAG: hypothetical protein H6843_07980 [Rhodospirillaceae bacterium]|nr:hypothetical protein [Rhodospirillaceae bacterium]
MRRSLTFLALVAALAGGCQTTSGFRPAPLPDDRSVVPPADEVAPELAAYSGTWHGHWGGELDSYLVVESIDPPSAEVIYAWGTSSVVSDSGWTRETALFSDGSLIVPLNPGIVATFQMTDDGVLDAEYTNQRRGWHSTATFRRAE